MTRIKFRITMQSKYGRHTITYIKKLLEFKCEQLNVYPAKQISCMLRDYVPTVQLQNRSLAYGIYNICQVILINVRFT